MDICNEIYSILDNFSIKNPVDIRIGGGTACPKYIFTYSGKKFILKKKRKEFTPADVALFDLSVITHLSEKGMPVVVPSYSADFSYELSEYIEGLHNFVQGDREEIASAASYLGKMHRLLHAFTPQGGKKWEREFLPSAVKSELLEHINASPRVFHGKSAVKKVLRCIDNLIDKYSTEGLTHSIVHGDYTSANVKFREKTVKGIFDFDWTSFQNTLYDISRALVYFCFTRTKSLEESDIWSLVQPCRINTENAKIFMASYKQEFFFTQADSEFLPFALLEFFTGSRIRAMRKVADENKARMLENGLVEMIEDIEKEKDSLVKACR